MPDFLAWAITALGIAAVAGLAYLGNRHRRYDAKGGGDHRTRRQAPRDFSPLDDAVRRHLASTHHDPNVFVPQAQIDDPDRLGETRPLVAPKRRPDMRQTLRHLAANENATEAERALAQGLLNVHEQGATQ